MKLSIPEMEIIISFDTPIQSLQVENIETYRKLYFQIESLLLLFEDDEELNVFTAVEVIRDIYSLNINNKKNINGLYKYLESYASAKEKDVLLKIESEAILIIESLSESTDFSLEYADDLSFSQLFSSMKLSFSDPTKDNILEYLLTYFKMLHTISKTRLVITFNLSYLLTSEELLQLSYELKLHNIYVFNININKHTNNSLIIDSDNSIF